MKFVIKDNTDKKDVEVELFLRTEPNGSISVCGINSDDVQRILVSFKNGKMYKHCSANMKGIITLSFSDRIIEQETMW